MKHCIPSKLNTATAMLRELQAIHGSSRRRPISAEIISTRSNSPQCFCGRGNESPQAPGGARKLAMGSF